LQLNRLNANSFYSQKNFKNKLKTAKMFLKVMRYLGFLEKNGNQKHRNFLGLIKDTNRTKIHTEKKNRKTQLRKLN